MPAVTRTQQRLFGQAYGVRMFKSTHGKQGINPKDLNPKYKEEIVKLANSMSVAELEKYASTKHKRLPERVKEGVIKDIYYHLSPDAQYDSSKEKSRREANLCDYREFIHKYKNTENGK
jgi:hypothetical protein